MPSPWVSGAMIDDNKPADPHFDVIGAETYGPFFSKLVQQFAHVPAQVASQLAPTFQDAFGLPYGTTAAMAELLMHAHAGNPAARGQVEKLATQPGMTQAMTQVSLALRQHPHFAHYQAHALREGQRVAVHGLVGAMRRRHLGARRVLGTI